MLEAGELAYETIRGLADSRNGTDRQKLLSSSIPSSTEAGGVAGTPSAIWC